MARRAISVAPLHGVAATCLFTLNARGRESARRDGMFRDPMAVALLERLDWDSSAFDHDWMAQTGIAVRTEILDEATTAYAKQHRGATIVNLGAGLCTRFFRVDDGSMEWIDVDLPTVVDLRRRLLPPHERCRLVAGSVLEYGWIDVVGSALSRPPLLIAEGLLQYFEPAEVAALLRRLAQRFPGAEMLLEAVSPAALLLARWQRSLVEAGVRVRWSLGDVSELERWSDRIHVVEQWYYDRHPARWRWLQALGWLPWVRRLMTIVHIDFVQPVQRDDGVTIS